MTTPSIGERVEVQTRRQRARYRLSIESKIEGLQRFRASTAARPSLSDSEREERLRLTDKHISLLETKLASIEPEASE